MLLELGVRSFCFEIFTVWKWKEKFLFNTHDWSFWVIVDVPILHFCLVKWLYFISCYTFLSHQVFFFWSSSLFPSEDGDFIWSRYLDFLCNLFNIKHKRFSKFSCKISNFVSLLFSAFYRKCILYVNVLLFFGHGSSVTCHLSNNVFCFRHFIFLNF